MDGMKGVGQKYIIISQVGGTRSRGGEKAGGNQGFYGLEIRRYSNMHKGKGIMGLRIDITDVKIRQ